MDRPVRVKHGVETGQLEGVTPGRALLYSIQKVFAVWPYCSYHEAEMSWKIMGLLRWRKEGLNGVQLSACGRRMGMGSLPNEG